MHLKNPKVDNFGEKKAHYARKIEGIRGNSMKNAVSWLQEKVSGFGKKYIFSRGKKGKLGKSSKKSSFFTFLLWKLSNFSDFLQFPPKFSRFSWKTLKNQGKSRKSRKSPFFSENDRFFNEKMGQTHKNQPFSTVFQWKMTVFIGF